MINRCSLLLALVVGTVAHAQDWESKVDAWVLRNIDAGRPAEFIVVLNQQADVSGALALGTRARRGDYVMRTLQKTAARTQPPLLELLRGAGVTHRAFWIANMIWVEGDRDLLRMLARREDVRRIHANPRVRLQRPLMQPAHVAQAVAVEPNINQTGAPSVFWSAGFAGEGVVVANQDTGVQWDHPALRDRYRGYDAGEVDHNYNWHDAIHSGGGVCGADSPEPCDDTEHGTLTMGVMVGDDGAGNQIGMAPGADWIACRNMDQGVGTPASYSECFEFFVAPTDLAGQNPDPSRAPHIINNSWVCPPSEGCEDPNMLLAVVGNTRAAGIVVVASAGNSGPNCESVNNIPASYDTALTVGAVNIFGELTQFSSRGPVSVDGSYRLKPDIVAPGDNVRSSVPGGYASASGTSLSGPHVAGMAALVLGAQPCFANDLDALEHWLTGNTVTFTTSEMCGAVAGTQSPNNSYGHGIMRAVLPTAADCRAPVAGALTGMVSGVARCTNRSAGAAVPASITGGSWDCTGAGLDASAQDILAITLRGTGTFGFLAGTATGLQPLLAVCQNRTSSQVVIAPVAAGTQTWDCSAAGLQVQQGDALSQTVFGRAH